MGVYSKKYIITVLGILVAIAAAVFAGSQWFVSQDVPEDSGEPQGEIIGEPYTTLPTSPPHAEPPTYPPPGN